MEAVDQEVRVKGEVVWPNEPPVEVRDAEDIYSVWEQMKHLPISLITFVKLGSVLAECGVATLLTKISFPTVGGVSVASYSRGFFVLQDNPTGWSGFCLPLTVFMFLTCLNCDKYWFPLAASLF